ncbi:MAG TPA: protein kinase, partial [Kofleriaceae bacterium]|nr:protein kinase [Kofleriaceae bacterium]
MIVAGQTLAERFELQRRIGSGGMGEVFAAFDRDRGELVALKTLVRADADTLARFKREFRALQTTAHPNLVSLRELIRDGEHWFFTMELVEGRHFLEYVRGRAAACDDRRLRDALRQLASGLIALHASGLVHRDIKPSNVMVTAEGRVVILDFGLVTQVDPAGQSSATGPVGTVEYMAPEQAVGRGISEAADWYSVGVMLYEALTGKVPHVGHALQILVAKQQVEPAPVEAHAPDAPDDLRQLCAQLLRIEPRARPAGADIARRLGLDAASSPPGRSISRVSSLGGVFVGRERELAELARAAERARDQPVIHLVAGESGIGKSELVARFVRDLAGFDAETLALAGRCYERESVPYKAFDGIADGMAQYLSELTDGEARALLPPRPARLVRLFPVFQRIAAVASAPAQREEPGEPLELRRRLFAALRHLLAGLTHGQQVIVSIDDLQWADADSFLLLRELLRGPEAPPLLVLGTVRGDGAVADAVAAQLEGLVVQRTALGPLNEDEIRVLAERLVPDAARLDLARIAREAGGHPMFLQEILRHLDASAAGAPSATLDDALWARVEQLHADARAVLEVVCIAGAPIAHEVAGLACRLDATAVARAAAALRVASLVREVQRGRMLALEPYHDRVREAVGGRLADAARTLHERVAAAIETGPEPRDPQLLLRNFVLAGLPERAARYAEEAAQRSEHAHAFDQAAELWHTALDLVPRARDDQRRLQLALGQALINAGRGAEAAEHFLAAAVDADRPTRLECHRHAAEQLIISGRIAPGMAALEALLAEIGVPTPKTPRRALLSLLRHRVVLRLRGLRFRERSRREIADAEILVLDVLKAAAHSLALVESIRGMDF